MFSPLVLFKLMLVLLSFLYPHLSSSSLLHNCCQSGWSFLSSMNLEHIPNVPQQDTFPWNLHVLILLYLRILQVTQHRLLEIFIYFFKKSFQAWKTPRVPCEVLCCFLLYGVYVRKPTNIQ